MSEEKLKPVQDEESVEGAPLWIISFADMISLLMAFFVMLSTFSTSSPTGSVKLQRVGKMTLAPNYGWNKAIPSESVTLQVLTANRTEQGSEKPTFEKDYGNNKLKQTQGGDYSDSKVFLIPSDIMFRGKSTSLSIEGRKFLDEIASFLKMVPRRLVIAENGPEHDVKNGILRSISVVEYLDGKGVPKGSCNIAGDTILPQTNFVSQRMLEISLFDKSIYE